MQEMPRLGLSDLRLAMATLLLPKDPMPCATSLVYNNTGILILGPKGHDWPG